MPDHGQSGTPTPTDARPSLAERARTLLAAGGMSTLSTHSAKRTGYPFGSVMPYALLPDGKPLFLISSMAVHTKNLLADSRATLLVVAGDEGDMLGSARLSLMGEVFKVDAAQLDAARAAYLARQPRAAHWIDYDDFHLFRLDPVDVYFVGGFGMMGWVTLDDFWLAEPDPLADVAESILEHVNADHADAVRSLVTRVAQIEAQEAKMTSVDRYGFSAKVLTEQGYRGARVDFPRLADSANDVRQVLIEMIRDTAD